MTRRIPLKQVQGTAAKAVRHIATHDAPAELVVRAGEQAVVLEEGRNEQPKHETLVLTVERGATLTYAFAVASDSLLSRNLTLKLADGARAELLGFVRATGNGNVRMTLTEDHASGASWARTGLRAIVGDAAAVSVRGMIGIRNAANRSDGFFEGRAVLLGDAAKAEIIPSLEIAAQDVKASHAAAVGPIDAIQLFYLQSRGCTLQEAETLVLDGFLEQFLSRIPDQQLRAELRFRWLTPIHHEFRPRL
ncbi:MAG: SufD family Fe-S cluster assembly protein [Candidatus Kerfeldbacteria bacterium]|nr:SufD family Fe-S cluster assembly protein [Candidatus Kerfeldbacteria bacterium]